MPSVTPLDPPLNRCRKLFSFSVIIMLLSNRRDATYITYTVEYIIIHGFYNVNYVIPNLVVRNKPNLDCFQGKYRRSDAENIGSVFFTVREKIGLHANLDNIRLLVDQ